MVSTSTDRLFGANSSLAFKAPVAAATTGNITLSGEQTIDGVAVVTGNRVLVKDQTTGADNGIYIADTSTWERAPDFNGARDVTEGTTVWVNDGSLNGNSYWRITTSGTIVIGTTSIAFGKSGTAGDVTLVERHIATAGQTAVTTDSAYNVGTNAIVVHVNGLLMIGGGVDYTETDQNTITFTSGLTLNDDVQIRIASVTTIGGTIDSANVSHTPAGTGATATNVKAKLDQTVSVKDFGATGDGVTDDSTAIQAAIDHVEGLGGGEVWFPTGTYICTGLVLADYVTLRGPEIGFRAATIGARLKSPSTGGIVVDTPNGTGITGCGLIGLNIYGYGASVAGKGVRFRDVDFGLIRNVMVQNFADEGILVDSTSIACHFDGIRLQTCLLDTTQAAKIGVFDLDGTDHYCNDIESTASSSALSDANAYLCAFVIRNANSMFKGCIGEISDIGFHFTSAADRNKLLGCRADLNFGHGFELASGASFNMFSSCHAYRNGRQTNNTYSGFIIAATAAGNLFSSCFSENASGDTNKCKYGFEDLATNALTANRSKFVACSGQNSVTSLFYVEPLTGTSPTLPDAPITMSSADTTPSIAGSRFLRCSAVSSATSVTDFDDGVNGQDLYLLGDVDVTIVHGSTIKTNTGKNKVLRANVIYHFKRFNGAWYEQAADQINTGTFTCSAAALTTVADTRVTASSIIQIMPTNAAAATLMGAATCLYISARTAGTSFGVTTANAAAAAGTETFNYIITEPN